MEKLEPSILPDGYSVSRAFRIVVDASQALMVAYDELTHKYDLATIVRKVAMK